jgi:hypothetical protein
MGDRHVFDAVLNTAQEFPNVVVDFGHEYPRFSTLPGHTIGKS